MQVFISLGGPTIRCDIDSKSIVIFPDKSSKQDVDLVLHSNPDEAPADKTISWPGEYDIGGIAIRGIGHQEGKMVSFVIETPQARCAFPVTPLHQWTDYELEQMGNIDVLVIPADDVKLVQKLVDEIDPRVLIPLPTKDEATFAEVLKVFGAKDKELEDEYVLKGSLPAEAREVIILKPRK